MVGFYEGTAAGCEAIGRILGSGLEVAAVEYLDEGALAAAGGSFPDGVPAGAGFLVVAEADGSHDEAARLASEIEDALGEDALEVRSPSAPGDVAALWRWREGVAFAAAAVRGGKVAEDVAVPLDRLAEIIDGTVEIGARHGLQAISWGHAGDGNVHSNFLVDPGDQNEVERADRAVEELFDLTVALGGTISGEHGLGWLKRGQLEKQWSPRDGAPPGRQAGLRPEEPPQSRQEELTRQARMRMMTASPWRSLLRRELNAESPTARAALRETDRIFRVKTRAAVLEQFGSPLVVQDVELAEPKEGEVLVRLVACGVCHTDLYTASGADPSGYTPCVLGHEGAWVERVGDSVTLVAPGDHVITLFGVRQVHPLSQPAHESLRCNPRPAGPRLPAGRYRALLEARRAASPLHGHIDLLRVHGDARDRAREGQP